MTAAASTVASRYRARGARYARYGADSAARRVAECRAVWRRGILRHGQLDALRHSLVCSSGGSTYMRAPPLESSTAARRAAALRRGYAALHRPALTTQPPRH